jgi:hypothetical protein
MTMKSHLEWGVFAVSTTGGFRDRARADQFSVVSLIRAQYPEDLDN